MFHHMLQSLSSGHRLFVIVDVNSKEFSAVLSLRRHEVVVRREVRSGRVVSGQRSRSSVAYPPVIRAVRSGRSVAAAVTSARQAVARTDRGRRRLCAVRTVARVRGKRATPAGAGGGARERSVGVPDGRGGAPHHVLPLEVVVGHRGRDVGRVIARLVGVVGVVAAAVGRVVLPR